ncbi:MAG TPA: hypothetical protein VFS89_08655 [Nitrosospira sp.]|nr:hypothetical protein [Nitrosospira sp.]
MDAAELFHEVEATQPLTTVLYAKVAKVDFLQSSLPVVRGQSSEIETIAPHFARAEQRPASRFRAFPHNRDTVGVQDVHV